jgi:hypothetical protein
MWCAHLSRLHHCPDQCEVPLLVKLFDHQIHPVVQDVCHILQKKEFDRVDLIE